MSVQFAILSCLSSHLVGGFSHGAPIEGEPLQGMTHFDHAYCPMYHTTGEQTGPHLVRGIPVIDGILLHGSVTQALLQFFPLSHYLSFLNPPVVASEGPHMLLTSRSNQEEPDRRKGSER